MIRQSKAMLCHQTALALPGHLDSWLSVDSRLRTFVDWPYDQENGSECTSRKLALSGFKMTDADTKSAKCVLCGKEMEFEPDDVPHVEHHKHSPYCFYSTDGEDADDKTMTVHRALKAIAYKQSFEAAEDTGIMTKQVKEAMETARERITSLLLDAEKQIHKT